jgi:RNA polymerase sigma factor (sigma-70 family)
MPGGRGSVADETFNDQVAATYGDQSHALLACARYELLKAGIPASRMTADDLVQEAVVVALTNQEKAPIRSLGGYLRAVIRHRARDEARRRGVADPVDTTAIEPRGVLWVSAVEDDVAARLDVEKALRGMSPQQRRLILLAKGAGYTQQELADFTKLNRGTVSRHIARATQVLAATMAAAFVAMTMLFGLGRFVAIPVASQPGPYEFGSPLFMPWLLVGATGIGAYGAHRLLKWRRETALRRTDVLQALIDVRHVVTSGSESSGSFPPATIYAAKLGIPVRWINEKTLRKGKLPTPRSKEEAVEGFRLRIHLPNSRDVEVVRSGRGENEVHYRRSKASSPAWIPGT